MFLEYTFTEDRDDIYIEFSDMRSIRVTVTRASIRPGPRTTLDFPQCQWLRQTYFVLNHLPLPVDIIWMILGWCVPPLRRFRMLTQVDKLPPIENYEAIVARRDLFSTEEFDFLVLVYILAGNIPPGTQKR